MPNIAITESDLLIPTNQLTPALIALNTIRAADAHADALTSALTEAGFIVDLTPMGVSITGYRGTEHRFQLSLRLLLPFLAPGRSAFAPAGQHRVQRRYIVNTDRTVQVQRLSPFSRRPIPHMIIA